MGATSFMHILQAEPCNLRQAEKELCAKCIQRYGDNPYNGSFSTVDTITNVFHSFNSILDVPKFIEERLYSIKKCQAEVLDLGIFAEYDVRCITDTARTGTIPAKVAKRILSEFRDNSDTVTIVATGAESGSSYDFLFNIGKGESYEKETYSFIEENFMNIIWVCRASRQMLLKAYTSARNEVSLQVNWNSLESINTTNFLDKLRLNSRSHWRIINKTVSKRDKRHVYALYGWAAE